MSDNKSGVSFITQRFLNKGTGLRQTYKDRGKGVTFKRLSNNWPLVWLPRNSAL